MIQHSVPARASHPSGPVANMPTWTVRETKNITTPWGR